MNIKELLTTYKEKYGKDYSIQNISPELKKYRDRFNIGYLIRDLKFPVNYEKMRSQWKNFLKKGFRPKGMYFTIRYLYFVQHNNPDKALGGIGLINEDTYKEAQTYWKELHDRQEALKASQPKEVKKIVIKREEKKKPKIKYDLSKIEEWENGR